MTNIKLNLILLSDINYFHCLQIVEILKTTEKDTKNIFGSYSSKRIKDWQQVLKDYEKNNLYLGEASQIFTRNVTYEIPNIRKQMTQLDRLSEESLKKSVDAVKSENILRNEYNTACQQLGIKGDKIKAELVEKLKDLPKLQEDVANKIPELSKALALYENFSNNKYSLPIIRHIIKSGNTTVYEYKYSEAPVSVEEPKLPFKIEDEDPQLDFGDNQEIDFGGGVDFGDENAGEIQLEVGEIDWGAGDVVENFDQEINFDISLEESGIVVEDAGMNGGVARDDEAFTLLDSPNYRDSILDELYELESFLKVRLYELSNEDKVHVISMSLLDGFTDHDSKTVAQMISIVDAIVGSFTTSLIQQLYQIKHSPKYVDILTNQLRQKLRGIDKLQGSQKTLKEKSVDLKQQAVDLRPSLDKLIEQTKGLQKNVSSYSMKFKQFLILLLIYRLKKTSVNDTKIELLI